MPNVSDRRKKLEQIFSKFDKVKVNIFVHIYVIIFSLVVKYQLMW